MLIRPALVISALSITSSLASIALYGQCGGDDIVWADTCSEGLVCQYMNFWYSQCLPPPIISSTATGDDTASTGTPSP
ncbi:hypothetical protein B0H17DRAFT_1196916 [Mycena rosella]|uniref:CBM1 domain-containing protein n=1 Tax=Mycena rosella TaxID=1033263 RepID=A0AAD7DUH4_MYCRO|nr:hypothetical protein B0H17DRAFT_1196916 [Mycena rosella]